MKPSEEVKKLNDKEGALTDLARQYLDVKKAKYSVIKTGPNDAVARLEGIELFVEPGSIMIEKSEKKVIIEELTKVCGISARYHDTDKKVRVNAILDRAPKILFRTHKDKKNLYIHTDAGIREPTFGTYLGGGHLNVNMEDILKEPSNIPDYDESFEINCKCEDGKLKCKGHAWEW